MSNKFAVIHKSSRAESPTYLAISTTPSGGGIYTWTADIASAATFDDEAIAQKQANKLGALVVDLIEA